jgi:general secretion pathway protein G
MKTLSLPPRSQRGFTLAEMMVVIVIIGLLATIVVPNVMQKFFASQTAKIKADITVIASALDQYAMANLGKYPDSLEALVTPDENGFKFLDYDQVPLDPYKNPYVYEPPGSGRATPIVLSYGQDGTPGGDGKDKDIDFEMVKRGDV